MKNLFSILIMTLVLLSCKKEEATPPTPKVDPVQGYELLLVNASDNAIPSINITDSLNYSVIFENTCYEKVYLPQKDVFYYFVDEHGVFIGKVIWHQVNENNSLNYTHGDLSSYAVMNGWDYNPSHCGSINMEYDYQITFLWTE